MGPATYEVCASAHFVENPCVPAADHLFERLPEAERRALRAAARRRRFRRGDTIFHEGEAGDTLHVIDAGHVAIKVVTAMGDVVTLTVLGPGESFGEQALLAPDARRTASAVCLDEVQTIAVGGDDFEDLRHRLPAVDRFLVDVLAAQVRRLSGQLVESLHVQAETRVLRRLATLAAAFGGDPPVIPVTQDDVASMAGTTRPTVNRALRALEAAGTVALGRGRITVLDERDLARRAGP